MGNWLAFPVSASGGAGEGVKAGDSALVPGSNEDNSKDENQQTERNVIERIDR